MTLLSWHALAIIHLISETRMAIKQNREERKNSHEMFHGATCGTHASWVRLVFWSAGVFLSPEQHMVEALVAGGWTGAPPRCKTCMGLAC